MNEDFNVYQEEDGSAAYIIVRHLGYFCIEQLDDDFYGGLGATTAKVAHVPSPDPLIPGNPPGDEAPIMFRRKSRYV